MPVSIAVHDSTMCEIQTESLSRRHHTRNEQLHLKHVFITIGIECFYFVGVNLALNKKAFESSVDHNGVASVAIDGNL